jgi:hypothetical protein
MPKLTDREKPLSPHLYRVHGLALASEIEFPELAADDGDRPPDIRICRGMVPAWKDAEPTAAAFVTRRARAVQLDLPGIARLQIADGREVTVESYAHVELPQLRAILLGSVMGLLCHQRGMMVLHASAVAFNGRAIAFTGEQRAGKSTLTAHCVSAGARLVADDVLVLSLDAGRQPMAYPGVPGVKLWRHALEDLGMNAEGLTQAWTVEEKYHVPFGKDVVHGPVPLARICVLQDDDTANEGTTVPLRGADAVTSLIEHTYRPEYLDIVDGRNRHFRDCVRLAAAVDVVRLARRRDPHRLAATAALIARSQAAA